VNVIRTRVLVQIILRLHAWYVGDKGFNKPTAYKIMFV
jgi:hypothetical protein